jgi:hypothetical protein
LSSVNWQQRTPAGFPSGIPGIGDDMDGAMQQAAHPERQFGDFSIIQPSYMNNYY